MADRGECPVCETEQPLKKDGTVYKHGDCAGAGQKPRSADDVVDHDDGSDWLDADGEAAPEPTQPEPVTDEPDEPQVAPLPPRPAHDGFTWELEVKSPAIYLGDASWHQANGAYAARKAEDAGHKVTGEPHWDGAIGGGYTPGTVLLTYVVPVAG